MARHRCLLRHVIPAAMPLSAPPDRAPRVPAARKHTSHTGLVKFASLITPGIKQSVPNWADIPDLRADRYGDWLVWAGQLWHAGSPGSFAYRLPVFGQGGSVKRVYVDGCQ